VNIKIGTRTQAKRLRRTRSKHPQKLSKTKINCLQFNYKIDTSTIWHID